MILSLHIKNIALIKELSVEFSEGLNVLSGETGAGKSIIIDSINFLLGGRADKTLIRHGESRASAEGFFEYDAENSEIAQFFADNGIDADDGIVVRRVMTADNRGECRVNGRLVTLSILKNLTGLLADIYGQNEHQSLLKTSSHIAVIDGLSKDIGALKEEVRRAYEAYGGVCGRIASFGDPAYRGRRLDILEFQIEEIERAELKDGEEDELKKERVRLSNAGRLTEAFAEAYELLEGGEQNAYSAVSAAAAALNSATAYDENINDLCEILTDLKSQLKDAVHDVKRYLDDLNYDEKYADRVEERLDKIKLIKKKYGATTEAVKTYLDGLKDEYDALKDSENILEKLQREKEKFFSEYIELAFRLSDLRRSAAQKFEADIKRELAELSMAGTTFKVEFYSETSAEYAEKNMRKDGVDSLEFLISPNAGEPLKPFSRIISGGEMSRFMLALKSIAADSRGVMIFDEIDTGISGAIAETVAEKLSRLSRGGQVLAVTHLPQLASYADAHFLISKGAVGEKTLTSLERLSREKSVAEIARLAGGSDTALAIPHAKNIKEKADAKKAGWN
ncbi:MAG: DNA repair protein RecN [Clostridiales bacterium]|jgi:DNA repair protein RecN (Recombination protein N)|nr:DNA repair protein RecN [Clostridiales bacterium]